MLQAFENFYNISNEYDIKEKKVEAYIEAAQREFNINIKQSEIKVIEESGTDADLQFLTEAAEEGFVTKLKNAIAAIIKAFTDFISDLKDKVVRIIVKKESRDQLKKIEKKIKLNPLLARKKVKISDKKKEKKLIKEYQNKCDKIIAQMLSKSKTVEITFIGGIQDSFDGDYRKAIAASVGTVTLTLAALVKLINKQIDELPPVLTGINKDTSGALQKLMNSSIDDEAAASCKAAYSAVARFRSSLGKKEANLEVQSLMENVKEAKRALKIDKKKPVVGESVEDDLYEDDMTYTEGTNLDIKKEMMKLKLDWNASVSKIKSYRKTRSYNEAIAEIKKLETVLNKYSDTINKIPDSVGSSIIGSMISIIKSWAGTLSALAMANTMMYGVKSTSNAVGLLAGASAVLPMCDAVVSQIIAIQNDIKTGTDITPSTFNKYRRSCIKEINSLKGALTKLTGEILKEKTNFEGFSKLSNNLSVESVFDIDDDYSDIYDESSDFDFSEFESEADQILEGSYDYDDAESFYEDDMTYTEGTNLDIKKEMMKLKLDWNASVSKIKSYRKTRSYNEAIAEIKKLETVLNKYSDTINKIPDSVGSSIIGSMISIIKSWAGTLSALAMANTMMYGVKSTSNAVGLLAGASAVLPMCDAVVSQIIAIQNDIKTGTDITPSTFNKYRRSCIKEINSLKGALTKLTGEILKEKTNFEGFSKLSNNLSVESVFDIDDDYSDIYDESSDFDFSEFESEADQILEGSYDYDDAESFYEDDDDVLAGIDDYSDIYESEYSASDLLGELDDLI